MVTELNDKQRDVCRLIGEGLSNKQIAARLDIAIRTVELRRTEIVRLLKINTKSLPVWVGQHIEEFQGANNPG